MTSIRIRIGPTCPFVTIRPLRRYIDADGVWLAQPVTLLLESGTVTTNLDPTTGAIGAYVVEEHGGITRCIEVPDSVDILDYESLRDLDPSSFAALDQATGADALAEWLAVVTGVKDAADTAAVTAQTAAVDALISLDAVVTAEQNTLSAATTATSKAALATAAQQAADTAQAAAVTAQNAADTARVLAETARTGAQTAATTAAQAAATAAVSATGAAGAVDAAITAQDIGGQVETATVAAVAAAVPPVSSLSRKIRGGNITVKPGGSGWQGMWAEWDWANWIKPQIDRAVALGMNAVRVIGSAECVLKDPTGTLLKISQATYIARWSQLAAYCTQRGLYLYPCLVSKWDFIDVQTASGGTAPWNFQASDVTTVVTAAAQTLAGYLNVIGFDLFQEGDTVSGMVLADVLAMYAAVRAVAPRVPLTTSNSSGNFGGVATFWNDATSLQAQAYAAVDGADFVDLHIYIDGITPGDIDGFLRRFGKPVIVGEYGAAQSVATATATARFAAMTALHNRRGILGSFAWALADQTATSADMWGVWDNTGFSQPSFPSAVGSTPLSITTGKRTYLTNALRKSAIAEQPETFYQPPNLLTATQARPVNSSSGTGWVNGANTYQFADTRGLGFSATAAGNTSVSTTVTTPVLASTGYVASVNLLAVATARAVSLQVDWYTAASAYITSSTMVTGTDATFTPTALSIVVVSPSTAAFGVLIVRVTAAAINEAHILLAYPQPSLRGF